MNIFHIIEFLPLSHGKELLLLSKSCFFMTPIVPVTSPKLYVHTAILTRIYMSLHVLSISTY